jgi:hypothetical protein
MILLDLTRVRCRLTRIKRSKLRHLQQSESMQSGHDMAWTFSLPPGQIRCGAARARLGDHFHFGLNNQDCSFLELAPNIREAAD